MLPFVFITKDYKGKTMRVHVVLSILFCFLLALLARTQIDHQITNAFTDLVPTIISALSSPSFISSIITTLSACLITIVLMAYFAFLIEKAFISKVFSSRIIPVLISWSFIALFILCINSLLYPFSPTSHENFSSHFMPFIIGLMTCSLIILGAVKNPKQLILLLFIITSLFYPIIKDQPHEKKLLKDKNVIFIGIDSLRPDYLAVNGFEDSVMPNVDQFIAKSIYFPKVYTPTARTFVSWTAILSGKNPINTGARFNLTQLEDVDKTTSLAKTLQSNGYVTIWAQDERRFNNIDSSYGFDVTVGPPADAAEFLISSINTIPTLSLFFNNTSLRLLSPYLYNNRAAWWTYEPTRFIDQILENIDKKNNNKPLFLATHLTLPHWPFKSSRLTFPTGHNFDETKPDEYLYLSMLAQVDEQFSLLMDGLAERNILQNSIVILLSDHGESFGKKNDGPINILENATFNTNSQGHGTNILSQSQFRVVTAIKDFSNPSDNFKYSTDANFSLIDITPTILERLKIVSPFSYDGIPVSDVEKFRPVYIESSLNPFVISSGKLQVLQTLAKGFNLYTVAKNGKLIVKEAIYNKSIAAKQRAIIISDRMLATFPDMDDEMIYVNLKSNRWQPASTVEDRDKIKNMFFQLCNQYSKDTQKGAFAYCVEPQKFLDSIYLKWQHYM